MELNVKILWVHTYLNGVADGMGELPDGSKVWFSRLPDLEQKPVDRHHVYAVSAAQYDTLWTERQRFCSISGEPLLHGDVRVVRRAAQNRADTTPPTRPTVTLGEDNVQCVRGVQLADILNGTPLATVPATSFSNYHVAHAVRYE